MLIFKWPFPRMNVGRSFIFHDREDNAAIEAAEGERG
jgi:hypothetical protein